jgi:hypothetical protein
VFFLGATLLLYYSQQRWSYYLLPLAIAIVAPLLGALFTPEHPRVARHWPANYLIGLSPNEQMKRRLPVLLGLILMPLFFLLTFAMPELITIKKDNLSEQRESCYQVARQIIRSGELNRVLPKPTTVLIATDLGAELLFFTPHRIIASNYHREGAGIKYVWDAQKMDNPKALRTHLNQRQVGALLICPTIDAPAASLMQQYVFKKPLPNWLHTIPYQLPPTPTAQDSSKQVAAVKPLLVKVVGK